MDKYMERQMLGHVWRIELSESEGRLAQLAVFLLRMRQPLHQTVLVDIFDAPAAFAREKERLVVVGLAPADATGVEIDRGIISPRVARGYRVAPDIRSGEGMLSAMRGGIRLPMPSGVVIHCR